MGKTFKKENMPRLWLNANGFKKIFEYTLERIIESTGKIQYESYESVCATTGFFACELYLKFIYAYQIWDKESETISIDKEHKLAELYEKLDSENARKITDYIKEKGEWDKIQFKKKLYEVSKGFVDWRYTHEFSEEKKTEERTLDTWFLKAFLDSLYNVSREIINKAPVFGACDAPEIHVTGRCSIGYLI